MSRARWLALIASAAILALGVAACGGGDSTSSSGGGGSTESEGGSEVASAEVSGEIAGAGSSAQQAAQEAWIAEFENANGGATISYDPVGSGGGREQFISGGVVYGGTDASLSPEEDELSKGIKRCEPGELIEIPDYVSPIAVVYNLPEIEELKLSPETVAKIFNQEITSWNDKAIAADNPGVELPDTRITPVNRSDESGTTENFVEYLAEAAPSVWTHEVTGNWPVKGGEAAPGNTGVAEAVASGEGAIGYVDESQAGELGIALIKVGSEFVGPTPEAAAKILESSKEDDAVKEGKYMFPYQLDRKTEASGTYPIVLVSYLLACTKYDSAGEAELVKSYLEYVISPEGQEVAAEQAGSAPLTDALRNKITPALEAIEG